MFQWKDLRNHTKRHIQKHKKLFTIKKQQMKKLKVAVIGTGHLGTIHTKLWLNNEDIDFAGIYDISSERSKQVSSELGVRNFSSLDELLK